MAHRRHSSFVFPFNGASHFLWHKVGREVCFMFLLRSLQFLGHRWQSSLLGPPISFGPKVGVKLLLFFFLGPQKKWNFSTQFAFEFGIQVFGFFLLRFAIFWAIVGSHFLAKTRRPSQIVNCVGEWLVVKFVVPFCLGLQKMLAHSWHSSLGFPLTWASFSWGGIFLWRGCKAKDHFHMAARDVFPHVVLCHYAKYCAYFDGSFSNIWVAWVTWSFNCGSQNGVKFIGDTTLSFKHIPKSLRLKSPLQLGGGVLDPSIQ